MNHSQKFWKEFDLEVLEENIFEKRGKRYKRYSQNHRSKTSSL